MGLDMYLHKRTYVKNFAQTPDEHSHKITVSKGGKKDKAIKTERICYIIEDVGYWRKANQIHKWFVDNVQGGEDDGKTYRLSKERLKELLDTVNEVLEKSIIIDGKVKTGSEFSTQTGKWVDNYKDGKVIENPEVAKKLLPTQEGFFFGDTDYDEYYIEDLKHTQELLTNLLAEEDSMWTDYEYYASW